MINFRKYCDVTWANLDKYANRKYIIDDEKVHFVRNRKTTLESIIKYPFYDCGRTTAVEAINFIRNDKGDKNMTLSKSNISQRRKLLDHVCYIDMNEDFIDGIYNDPERPGLYRGYSLLAGDTSICDAPNIGFTEKQLKELNNPHLNRLKKELIRFRVSCIADTQTDFILTSTITNSKKNKRSRVSIKPFRQLKTKKKYEQYYHFLR